MKFLLLSVLIATLLGCNEKAQRSFFWVTNHCSNKFDTAFIKVQTLDSLPSGAKSLVYLSKDTVDYFVRPDTLFGSQVNRYMSNTKSLKLKRDSVLYKLATKFHVYEFWQEPFDSGEVTRHFWEPSIGVFAVTSTGSLRKIRILQSNDATLNNDIDFLLRHFVSSPCLY